MITGMFARLSLMATASTTLRSTSVVTAVTPSSIWTNNGQQRTLGTMRSHSASKKRFKSRAGGGMVYKPSGRKHGMHRHSRNRNRTKGAAVVINRNENGDMWRRLRGVNLAMRNRKIHKPRATEISGTEMVYQFSTQIQQNKSLLSIVSTEVTTAMAPKVVAKKAAKAPTPKKVQWRTAASQ